MGKPTINSSAHILAHNSKVDCVSGLSLKIPTCKALAIKAQSTFIRNHLVFLARDFGFKRIGMDKIFMHLDMDDLK